MPNAGGTSSAPQSFVGEWTALFDENPDASPFLSPGWVAQWHSVHEADLAPRLFRWCPSATDAPAALALLVPRTRRRAGLRFRQIFLNTDGEAPADSVVIENNRLLCRPALREQAVEALAAYVMESRADEFIASGIDETELACLQRAFPRWTSDVEARRSDFVDLAAVRAAGGDPLACLRANTRAQVRRSMRKYEAIGPLETDVAETSGEATALLEELIRLHEQRWHRGGKAGAFASAKRRAFHFGFVEQAVPRGEAHLCRVRAGRQTIGVLYSLTAHGLVNFYQSGLQLPADGQLKPGLVSHLLAIRHFSSRGFREYDFLASAPGESRYKQSLATNQRTLYWLALSRPNTRNALLRIARRARGLLRPVAR